MVDDAGMSRPNVLFVIADDHAPAAISSYGASLVATPNLDRLASEGARFDRCFCTNSICTPARATVLTGKYSHTTGIRTLNDVIDHTRERTLGMMLHDAGYQTAALGKWHLGHGGNSDPVGFDHWSVLPVQGKYVDPEFHEAGGTVTRRGYVTDILADMALDWLRDRDPDRPFFSTSATRRRTTRLPTTPPTPSCSPAATCRNRPPCATTTRAAPPRPRAARGKWPPRTCAGTCPNRRRPT